MFTSNLIKKTSKCLIEILHLQIFDDEKRGYITMEEFRSVMTTLGEKLSHSDVDEMVTMTGIGKNGKVKYKGMFWFNKQRLRSHISFCC